MAIGYLLTVHNISLTCLKSIEWDESSQFNYCHDLHQYLQTIDTLILRSADLGAKRAEYFANMLKMNHVILIVFWIPSDVLDPFAQTPHTLTLRSNNLGAEGAKHLANALRINRVKQTTFLGQRISIFRSFTRHFTQSGLLTTTQALKEQIFG